MLVRGRARYPRPPTLDGARRGPLCRRLVFPALPGLLARLRQPVERALDASNHAGGDARIARRRIQLVVTQRSRVIMRSEEHTSELQSHSDLVCRLLLEKKNN